MSNSLRIHLIFHQWSNQNLLLMHLLSPCMIPLSLIFIIPKATLVPKTSYLYLITESPSVLAQYEFFNELLIAI